MLLAIDSGNTNITFGLYKGVHLVQTWRLSTDPARSSDEYGVWFAGALSLAKIKPSKVKNIIIANVVPATIVALDLFCEKMFAQVPLKISDQKLDLGIKVLSQTPQEAGEDRVVNVVGGYALIGQAGMVIDFGTATTFDVMDEAGNYCGGVIAPGVNLSLKALYEAAAQLSRVPVIQPEKVIGTSTKEAMQSGIFWGYVSLIEGLIGRVKSEMKSPAKVVATGGLSCLFSKAIPAIDLISETLTLDGLHIIYQRNL